MKRRNFVSLAGMGAVGASWPSPLRATARRYDEAEELAQEDPRFREISGLIEEKMAEYRVPGVAFGLVKNGSLAMRGFGLTNLENPQPVTPDTIFPLASITKTVVTVAMLRLVEQGSVDLDAPVRQYLPDFRVGDDEATRTVTTRHLLTHTPGWEGQLPSVDRGDRTTANFVEGMADHPQLARPGEVWSYNNAGFRVAGRIIEVVSGSVLYDALRDLVFDPLGLDLAFSRMVEAMSFRFAAPHTERDGRTAVVRPYLPLTTGSGGAVMSMSALMAYARFHLGDGTGPTGEPVLSPASLKLMRTPQLVKKPTTDEMGVGWPLRRLNGVLTVVHCGSHVGHRLHLQFIPDRDLAFALLTNHGGGWMLNEDVATALLERYEDLALSPNQRTGGNRGGSERMNLHAEPLTTQPALDEYVGRYDRAPRGERVVRADGGRLRIGEGDSRFGLVFYAPDMTYVTGPGAYEGMPVEFIREARRQVRWMRSGGRIARKV